MTDNSKAEAMELPCGKFGIDHNCSTCVYANWYDKDSYGRVHCEGPYHGYNRPGDRNGCIHWKG